MLKNLVAPAAARDTLAAVAQDSDWWRAFRAPDSAADRSLSIEARQWLRLLPAFAWPRLLCARHPRIANHLATLWAEPAAFAEYLDGLLVDARGGRNGFAPSIRAEIVRLGFFHRTTITDEAAIQQWKTDVVNEEVDWRQTA